jgi:molybdate transport system substrate-binding protein
MSCLLRKLLVVTVFVLVAPLLARSAEVHVAAAADLKFALDEIVSGYKKDHPGDTIQVTYGSSGKFYTQIQQGAPYDLYFSADISYPRELVRLGMAASDVRSYAFGRLVIWSSTMDATKMTLANLTDPKITKIAIANPKHAPYGKRAEEALRSAGIWEKVQPKLVFGENISQAAQYVLTGNAQVGIIALSLVLTPELSKKGGYYLIPDNMYNSLEQGCIVTKRGANNPLAKKFAEYMGSKQARGVMTKYGFVLPGEK